LYTNTADIQIIGRTIKWVDIKVRYCTINIFHVIGEFVNEEVIPIREQH